MGKASGFAAKGRVTLGSDGLGEYARSGRVGPRGRKTIVPSCPWWTPIFRCADKVEARGWEAPFLEQAEARMTTGLPAANTMAESPLATLRSLHPAAARAVAPKQSRAAITPRGPGG